MIKYSACIEDAFYEHLQKYLTTDEERWDNNYPKQSPDKAGYAVYKERKGSESCKCFLYSSAFYGLNIDYSIPIVSTLFAWM